MTKTNVLFISIVLCLGGLPGIPTSQAQPTHIEIRPPTAHVIIPQGRAYGFTATHQSAVRITDIEVLIDILESTATTTLDIHLENNTSGRQEAELMVPVPDGAVIRGFAYDGPHGQRITARVLPRDEARRIYQQLVNQIRDPALVEFMGYNLIRSSVFPIESQGKQCIRLTYEHLLYTDGNRIDYVLPRTESLQYDVPWSITVHIKARHPVSTVYSPSHHVIDTRCTDNNEVSVQLDMDAQKTPGPFRLSYLMEKEGVTASLFAYPDEQLRGGYFLLLAGLPAEKASPVDTIRREVTLVIDRSGSMRHEKIEQTKEAALQVIAGLQHGEAFNIFVYSNTVESFAPQPVIKDEQTAKAARAYMEGITPMGGTSIHDALKQALAQAPTAGMLPIVLFLTDGLPTVGQTSEAAIRDLATGANPYKRRIFTLGVGLDVNAPLLEKLAELSRARAEFVLPQEDVEVKIGKVFQRLAGPVLADPQLQIQNDKGTTALGRTRDLLPAVVPDLFAGDQLVLLGRYVGEDPLTFVLSGNYRGTPREFTFAFALDKACKKNGFVARLWASRKIAELIDLVRQTGADAPDTHDPRIKELTEEIVRLSTEFGILTEYTAFLAREGATLTEHDTVVRETMRHLDTRAIRGRSEAAGVVQSLNAMEMKGQKQLRYDNFYLNDQWEQQRITTVQHINDMAFYNKSGRWIDSRLARDQQADLEPDEIIEFGSDAFISLAERLAREDRQASLAFAMDVLIRVDGRTVLVRMPK